VTDVLIHIGYHKSGSSWLQQQLFSRESAGFGWLGKTAGSPVRRFVDDDPLDFDASALRQALEPLLEGPRGRGLLPVLSMERLSGHPFSGGYDCKEIADRLAAVLPEGSVLVVVREQRSMIASTYKQYVRAGGAGTVEQFLDPPSSKSRRVPWFDPRYFEYDRLLRHYVSLFGADRVLCLPFEQLASDGPAFAGAIARFAGRPFGQEELGALPYDDRSNQAPSAAGTERQRRRNKLGVRSELNPTPVFGAAAFERLSPELVARALRPRLDAAELERSLTETVDAFVGDRYLESNRRTARLAGADLATFGWRL
jgi:hypothetical protein